MPHRAHLFSLRIAHAFREACIDEPYRGRCFLRDLMTKVTDITLSKRIADARLPEGWQVFKINGPLFFAAADRILGEPALMARNARGFVLYSPPDKT